MPSGRRVPRTAGITTESQSATADESDEARRKAEPAAGEVVAMVDAVPDPLNLEDVLDQLMIDITRESNEEERNAIFAEFRRE